MSGRIVLSYRRSGGGPPVVLLHGQPGSGGDWSGVVTALAGRADVIAVDRPGYGDTGGQAVGFRSNADAVAALLDRLGLPGATVVGHSWAGGIGLALAEAHPARLDGLVLIAPVSPLDPVGVLDRLIALPAVGGPLAASLLRLAGVALLVPPLRHLIGSRHGPPEDAASALGASWLRRPPWRSFLAEQRFLVDELPTLAGALGHRTVPTVVVAGEADRIVPAATSRRLAAAIPGARLVELRGAGHLLPHDHADQVADCIASLLPASPS